MSLSKKQQRLMFPASLSWSSQFLIGTRISVEFQTRQMVCVKSVKLLKFQINFKSLLAPHRNAYHFGPLDPTLCANADSL